MTNLDSDQEIHDSSTFNMKSFDMEHNSLVKINLEGHDDEYIQLIDAQDDMKFNFYYQGGKVEAIVYDERQYLYKGYMAPPVKVDHSRSVLSPMPGAIVSVSVKAGDKVVDGQDLCIVEAMKMQNILKSERDGTVKSVNVKAGDSVTVDELLIEFE